MELDVDRLARALLVRQSSVFKVVVEACAEDNDITAETAADIGRDAEEAYAVAIRETLIDFGWIPASHGLAEHRDHEVQEEGGLKHE